MQQKYIKATPEEKSVNKYFLDLPIEQTIDEEAIGYAKGAGLKDPIFHTGRLSNCTLQKLNYMKSKHRTSFLLRKWSADGYWYKQNDLLKIHDPETFTDNIERVNVDDITVEEFIEKYEKASKPCIITGVTDTWPGMTEW